MDVERERLREAIDLLGGVVEVGRDADEAELLDDMDRPVSQSPYTAGRLARRSWAADLLQVLQRRIQHIETGVTWIRVLQGGARRGVSVPAVGRGEHGAGPLTEDADTHPEAGERPLEHRPVAVVTGAGRGIGRLLALRLSGADYAVALVVSSQQELRETARLIEISGGRALCLPADVTDEADAPEVIRRHEAELGPIELLVNNAGILGPTGPTWEVGLQAWRRTVDTNLFGALVYTRLALARMVPAGAAGSSTSPARPGRTAGRPSPPTPCPRPR